MAGTVVSTSMRSASMARRNAPTSNCGMTTVALRLTTVVDFKNNEQRPWWKRWLATDEDRRNDLWSYVEVRDAARVWWVGSISWSRART